MLSEQAKDVRGRDASPVAHERQPRPALERECESYTRYLSGRMPTPYVVEKYLDFHQKIGFPAERDRFDRFLVSFSACGPFRARLADSYASVFRKNSAVRKKLVVTLALLECAPPTFEELDRVPPAGAVLRLAMGAMMYASTLLIAAAFLTPVRLWTARIEH